jgi:SpoIIAA-like
MTSFETDLAVISRSESDLVEVRFKPGITLTKEGIQGILNAREQVGQHGPPARILIVLPDVVDFDMGMITTDHYKDRPVQQHSRALAWVVHTESNERFTKLYFAYFPSPVPMAVFHTEAEALTWLAAQ